MAIKAYLIVAIFITFQNHENPQPLNVVDLGEESVEAVLEDYEWGGDIEYNENTSITLLDHSYFSDSATSDHPPRKKEYLPIFTYQESTTWYRMNPFVIVILLKY